MNRLTSPAADSRRMSMLEATSMLPARAFRWTPLGAFILRERVGDSSLKDDIIIHPNDLAALVWANRLFWLHFFFPPLAWPTHWSRRHCRQSALTLKNHAMADGSPQIFEELRSQQGNLHWVLEQSSFRTWGRRGATWRCVSWTRLMDELIIGWRPIICEPASDWRHTVWTLRRRRRCLRFHHS